MIMISYEYEAKVESTFTVSTIVSSKSSLVRVKLKYSYAIFKIYS